jgi:aminocarboxymuconate-semialdehyde decarboxylase
LPSGRYAMSLTFGVSFPLETTVAAARLILADVPTRWPRVKFLLSHGGGTLPYLLGRLDQVWGEGDGKGPPPSQTARRFYADSILYSSEALAFAARSFGHDRVMWGSDHPFYQPEGVDETVSPIKRGAAKTFLEI